MAPRGTSQAHSTFVVLAMKRVVNAIHHLPLLLVFVARVRRASRLNAAESWLVKTSPSMTSSQTPLAIVYFATVKLTVALSSVVRAK